MTKKTENFKLLKNIMLGRDVFVMELQAPGKLEEVFSGQFAEVEVPGNKDVFLRRPFSVHDVDYDNNILKLYIKIVGKGSKTLSELQEGEELSVIYPLGNRFNVIEEGKALLIGGGTGVAPMMLLAKHLKEQGVQPDILIGGRTKDDIQLVEEHKELGSVLVTTEDGSMGTKGFVTNHAAINENVKSYDKIYTCGPEPMMQAIAKIARANEVDCEVSLENMMACGIGACLCCVTKTNEGNLCVCTEGPVFDYKNLKDW